MDYKSIAEKIIELKNADFILREKLLKSGKLSEGYDEEMKELHDKNAKILNDIIDTIGYPTIDKVGREARSSIFGNTTCNRTTRTNEKRCITTENRGK